ncbi:MAG: hypothetical protein Q9227_007813 [Pyrenula ochraceoflavens]
MEKKTSLESPTRASDLHSNNGPSPDPKSRVSDSDEKPAAFLAEDIEKTEHEIHPPTEYSEEEYKRVIRKLDWNILPMVIVLYSLSVLDRSNLGNARIAGLEDDINISGDRYSWLGTVFYIAYILSQWTQIGWKIFKPHNWIASAVFIWGLISTLQATATGWGALMVCRTGLAIVEAMYGPGIPIYLSYFYPRERLGFRVGFFLSGSALANAYGGALAYGITQAKSSVVAPWQILFIVEGVPTCILAIVAWFTMPDSPATARFLNQREKDIATELSLRQPGDRDHAGLQPKQLLGALMDWKCYPPGIVYFGCNVCFGSLPLFLPTIISELGAFSTIQSQGLTAPPYLLCFFTIVFISWISDKVGVRGPFISAFGLIAAIGYIIQATTTGVGVRYFAMFLSVMIFVSVACVLIWVSNMHATDTKRAGALAICATMGQCGPVLGTNIFPKSEGPYYRKGMWVSAGACLIVFVVSAAQSAMLWRENRARDRKWGKGRDEMHTRVTDSYGRDEYFRYVI